VIDASSPQTQNHRQVWHRCGQDRCQLRHGKEGFPSASVRV
jgi:hypothetical protein